MCVVANPLLLADVIADDVPRDCDNDAHLPTSTRKMPRELRKSS
ncbi:hypothetical protein I552_8988 [Mycobacterium xenopi 3993]|nr:hypothetical protein I552_8988 [Mycobacterium xenopi 3993]